MSVYFYEKVWIAISALLIVIFIGSILITSASHLSTPPSHIETIKPQEVMRNPQLWKPGVVPLSDGSLQVTITARIWSFIPSRLEIPSGRKVRFRITSPDVIHGFQIIGTNINMMAVPGYISEVATQFDLPGKYLLVCNEYCGIGHHNMSMQIEVKNEPHER